MKKSVCLSQDSNLGSLIYLYGLIQPIRGRNRVKDCPPRFLDFPGSLTYYVGRTCEKLIRTQTLLLNIKKHSVA